MSVAHYEIFEDEAGEWRWRLRAANGEIIAQSEAYASRSNAFRGAKDAFWAGSTAEFPIGENS